MVCEHIDDERRDAANLDERTRIRVTQAMRRRQDSFDLAILAALLLAFYQMNDRTCLVRSEAERSA